MCRWGSSAATLRIVRLALRSGRPATRQAHVYVYQLGDHDPSGVDAWRAFRKTVCGFLLEEHRTLRARLEAAHPEADYGGDAYRRRHL